MATITLYESDNTTHKLDIGEVIPRGGGGGVNFNASGTTSGTVNGVSLPRISLYESGNSRTSEPLNVVRRGTNFFSNGTTYYTKPNMGGSKIVTANGSIQITSGNWFIRWGDKIGANITDVNFVYVNDTALSQYDQLTLLIKNGTQEQIYYGAFATMLWFIFCNDLSDDLQTRYNSGNTIFSNINNNNNPIGGDDVASYTVEGDVIDLPNAPNESVSGVLASGFLNIYSPSASDLQSFGGALWTNAFNTKWYDIDSVSNLLLNVVSNPIDFIIGLFMLPVTPSKGSNSGIYLGGLNVNTVSTPRVNKQFVTVDFGSIAIDELYGNYLDYAYSKLSIYLPYIGMCDIDVQEVTGGSVHLQYIIDVFTGACVANVKCAKTIKTPWGFEYVNSTVHSYSGNVALQLPISAGSFDTMTQGLINVGLGLVSGQPQTVAKGATDIIQNVGGDATTRGSLSSNTGRLCYQTPYLIYSRPIETRPANLGNLHGYSAGAGGTLSQFSGYVECSDVKLDGITATDSEKDMIETLLKSGVYV